MHGFLAILLALATAAHPAQRRAQPSRHHVNGPAACGDPVAFQVLLDRRGFSTGQIDGALGVNASRVLAAFQSANHLPVTGRGDCATWQALTSVDAEPAL